MKRLSTDKFIINAIKVHGNTYDYHKSKYVTAKTKIIVICKEHGDFEVTPDNHISKKSGCPKCFYSTIGRINNMRLKGTHHNYFLKSLNARKKNFLKRAKDKHGDKYNYSVVVYKSNKTPITIICNIHGKFTTMPLAHVHGSGGCPICKHEKRRKSLKDFVDQSKAIHGNKYNYDKVVYKNCMEKVCIVCPKHADFFQVPSKHLMGHGCHKCRSSHGERVIRQWLVKNKIDFEEQKRFKACRNPETNYQLVFDFYISDLRMCIEFDGEQHFRPRRDGMISKEEVDKTQTRDEIKNNFCNLFKITLVRIPYTRLYGINRILEKKILLNDKLKSAV